MKTTDDSGAGPWPLPVEFDPDWVARIDPQFLAVEAALGSYERTDPRAPGIAAE